MTERTTALIYVRKSKVRKGVPDPASPELQEKACLEVAERRGWQAEVFSDAEGHRSGKSENRPAYQRLRARMKGPDVTAVIVYRYSRIARNVRLLLALVDELDALGVQLVSASDSFDATTAQGRLMLSVMGSFDEYYANEASDQRAAAIDYLRREKGRHYGLAPFGTERQPQNGDLVLMPSPKAQPNGTDHDALLHLYDLYVTERQGLRPLAIRLNREGWFYRDQRGNLRAWTNDDVRRCLASHWLYAGYITIGRAYRGRVEILPGSHAPILPEALTGQVAARLAAFRKYGPRRRQPYAYPLSGLLYCACGARLRGTYANGGRRYRHIYPCPNKSPYEHDADRIETMVRERIAALSIPDDLLNRNTQDLMRLLAMDVNRGDRSPETERTRLEAALARLRDLYTWGDVDQAAYESGKARIAAQMPPGNGAGHGAAPEFAFFPEHISEVIHDSPPPILRDLARALYSRIVIAKRWELEYHTREWCAAWA